MGQALLHETRTFEAELKTWGNSYGIRVSRKDAEQLGVRPGDPITVQVTVDTPISGFGICPGLAPFERDRDDRF